MGRVLLINDSKFESMIMKDTFASMGYNVRVTDEFNAMEEVRTFTPDVVVANLIMKEIRGDQLIALIKLQYPGIKCLVSSNNPIHMQEFKYKKVDAVFQTPADKAKLENILRSLDTTKDNTIVTGPSNQSNPGLCASCGHALRDREYTFCPYCGNKV